MCSILLGGVTAEQVRIAELEAIVAAQAATIEAQQMLIVRLEVAVALWHSAVTHAAGCGDV